MTITRQEARALIDEIAERMAPQTVRTMRLQQLEKAQIYTTKIAFAAALEELVERIGLPDSSGRDSEMKDDLQHTSKEAKELEARNFKRTNNPR